MQYEVAARRTAGGVGPGSYNLRKLSIDRSDVAGTPIIRPYHVLKNPSSNGYFFIGDQVVHDPSFDKKERKSSKTSIDIKTLRQSSASNHRDILVRHQDSIDKMKNSPYLAHKKKIPDLQT